MNSVTDIVLLTAIDDGAEYDGEHPNADKISRYLKDPYGYPGLNKVAEYAGGQIVIEHRDRISQFIYDVWGPLIGVKCQLSRSGARQCSYEWLSVGRKTRRIGI